MLNFKLKVINEIEHKYVDEIAVESHVGHVKAVSKHVDEIDPWKRGVVISSCS